MNVCVGYQSRLQINIFMDFCLHSNPIRHKIFAYFNFLIFLDKTKVSGSCKEGDFLCPTDGTCIPGHWLCDGTVDCVRDAADEENCSEYQNIICCQALCQFSSLIFLLKISKD